MAVRGGGIFEQRAAVLARLREGPGEQARQVVAVAPSGPAPSRWTLRTIRATVDWLQPYSLSGVWRVLTGLDLRLRSAQVQQYSPDPEYAAKEARLHACLLSLAGPGPRLGACRPRATGAAADGRHQFPVADRWGAQRPDRAGELSG
jgi:hypothetical protein